VRMWLAQGILEHTLFKGTYFPTWEGLFWEKVCPLPMLCFPVLFCSSEHAVYGGRLPMHL